MWLDTEDSDEKYCNVNCSNNNDKNSKILKRVKQFAVAKNCRHMFVWSWRVDWVCQSMAEWRANLEVRTSHKITDFCGIFWIVLNGIDEYNFSRK